MLLSCGMMKIEGPKNIEQTAKTRGKRKITSAEGDFSSLLGVEEKESTGNLSGVQPMGMLDGLLSIQQLENDVMEKKKAIQQGDDVLDYLDQLRHGLLRGRLSTMQVQNLVHAVKQMNYNVSDPRLKQILGAIETRAAVELAKLEMNRVIPPSH